MRRRHADVRPVPQPDERLIDLKLFWLAVSGRRADDLEGIWAGIVFLGAPGMTIMLVGCKLVDLAFGR